MKPVTLLCAAGLALAMLMILVPATPSADARLIVQVMHASVPLAELAPQIERFVQQQGRMPAVAELEELPRLPETLVSLRGNNPYIVEFADHDVDQSLAGKTVAWHFDEENSRWDRCSYGTVERRFRARECRKRPTTASE